MPTWLRKFTFNTIKEFQDSQDPNKDAEETWVTGKPKQKITTIDPKAYSGFNYTAKGSKK